MPNEVSVVFAIDKDQSGRTVLRQIDKGVDDIGKTSQSTSSQVDALVGAFKVALILDFFKSGVQAAFEFGVAAVKAFTEANNAALGLASVAAFKGIEKAAAAAALSGLDLVKNGLLSTGEASLALKNLLSSGFNLEQSIELIKRFGDSAAFGKQASLSFGQAVTSATEGVKNQNSILVDNAGVTKNLSVILKERGFELQDISDKVKGAAAREALYSGLLAETAAQVGDAARRSETFAGGQDKLAASQEKILVTVGKLITENPDLNQSFQELGKSLEIVNNILKDSDSELSQLVKAGTTTFAALVSGAAGFLNGLEGILGLLRDVSNEITFGASNAIIGQLFPKDSAATADILARAKKFREAFDAATKANPTTATDAKTPFKATEKDLEALKKFMAEGEAKAKKFEENLREVGSATADLQLKLSSNPIGAMFDLAAIKQAAYLEKFKEVPDKMVAAFKKASDDVARLDLFKGTLSQGLGIGGLQSEIAKLEAGLGGKKVLTPPDDARVAKINSGLIDSQLATANELATRAETAGQKALINQSVISSTSDIKNLTPGQVEARLKALNDQLILESAAFKENFERLKAQTKATDDNTFALVAVGNRLASVEGALTNFKEGALTINIKADQGLGVDLGSVPAVASGNSLSNDF